MRQPIILKAYSPNVVFFSMLIVNLGNSNEFPNLNLMNFMHLITVLI